MHHEYWGLQRPPFSSADPATRTFHEGEPQQEALARLRYVVRQRLSIALVSGACGCGKSEQLRRFASECEKAGHAAAVINLDGATPRELLWRIAARLAINPSAADSAEQLARRLANWAAAAAFHPSQAILLCDDADRAGPDVSRQMTRVIRLAQQTNSGLSVVMTTQQPPAARLDDAILNAIDLHVDLEPWEESDTLAYIQIALFEAGCDRPIFDNHAIQVLQTLTGGAPRDVNRLAEHALMCGASAERETIDAATLESAYDALKPVMAV